MGGDARIDDAYSRINIIVRFFNAQEILVGDVHIHSTNNAEVCGSEPARGVLSATKIAVARAQFLLWPGPGPAKYFARNSRTLVMAFIGPSGCGKTTFLRTSIA